MMNDKELVERIHMLIHSARLLKNYKPSKLDIKISNLIIQRFEEECAECKEIKYKNDLELEEQKGFFDKIFNR